jgi:hypothetical protein
MHAIFLWEILKEREDLEDVMVDVRAVFNYIFMKQSEEL